MTDENNKPTPKKISLQELADMTREERDRFIQENPDADIGFDESFWENAEPVYDPKDPSRLTAFVRGPVVSKKGSTNKHGRSIKRGTSKKD